MNAVGFLEDICLGNIVGNNNNNDNYNDQSRDISAQADHERATGASAAAAATTEIFPNLRTFNLVLATLATGGKWKKALEISAPMRSFRAPSDSGAAQRQGRGRPGRGAAASAAAAAAAVASVSARIPADGETYTHLIIACGKGEQPDK